MLPNFQFTVLRHLVMKYINISFILLRQVEEQDVYNCLWMNDASYIFIEREYWMKKKTFSLFCMFIQYPFWQVHRHHEKVFLLFSSSSCFSVIINITFINIPFFRTKILIVKLILTQKLVWYWGMHKNNLFLMRMQYNFSDYV